MACGVTFACYPVTGRGHRNPRCGSRRDGAEGTRCGPRVPECTLQSKLGFMHARIRKQSCALPLGWACHHRAAGSRSVQLERAAQERQARTRESFRACVRRGSAPSEQYLRSPWRRAGDPLRGPLQIASRSGCCGLRIGWPDFARPRCLPSPSVPRARAALQPLRNAVPSFCTDRTKAPRNPRRPGYRYGQCDAGM